MSKKAPIWILCLLLLCAGCGQEGSVKDDAFVVGLEGNPTNLDPRFATDAYSQRIRPLLFDSLIEVAPDGNLMPSLAESWSTADGLSYTFTLRPGVTFHDGKPLTSKDVKYTFDYLQNPANKCPSASSMKEILSVETPDERTVIFRLDHVFVPVLYKLVKGIVPAHRGDDPDFADSFIGSGPFRLTGSERGEKIYLEANEDYFLGAPSIKKIRFEVARNDTTRMLRLRKGDLHLVQNAVPPYAVKFFQRTKGLQVIRQPGINYSYLGFNLKDPKGITDRLEVRRAIAHAIDRDQIIRTLLKGQARKATGLLAPENWAYTADVPVYEFDPDKARALLDKAGLIDPDGDGPAVRFTLSYKTSTNKLRNRIAEVIAMQFADIGVGLERRSYEWGTFYEDIKKGSFQTFTLSWVGITDPDIFDYVFHSKNQPPVGANRGRLENPEIDRMIEQSRIQVDPEKRIALFHGIQQLLADQCIYVSLWWDDAIIVADAGLEGFQIFPGGEYTSLATAVWNPAR